MLIASVYGRLAFDPVQRTTKAGKSMATGRLAADATGSQADEPETLWLDLLCFGHQAEALLALEKGQMVSCIGRLTKGRYTTKDGTEREQLTLIADAIVSAKSSRPRTRKPSEPGRAGELPFDDALGF